MNQKVKLKKLILARKIHVKIILSLLYRIKKNIKHTYLFQVKNKYIVNLSKRKKQILIK